MSGWSIGRIVRISTPLHRCAPIETKRHIHEEHHNNGERRICERPLASIDGVNKKQEHPDSCTKRRKPMDVSGEA